MTIDPRNDSTTFAYDRDGHVTFTTFSLGGSDTTSTTDARNHTTTSQFDVRNRQTTLTDANGDTTQWTYDANNLRKKQRGRSSICRQRGLQPFPLCQQQLDQCDRSEKE